GDTFAPCLATAPVGCHRVQIYTHDAIPTCFLPPLFCEPLRLAPANKFLAEDSNAPGSCGLIPIWPRISADGTVHGARQSRANDAPSHRPRRRLVQNTLVMAPQRTAG